MSHQPAALSSVQLKPLNCISLNGFGKFLFIYSSNLFSLISFYGESTKNRTSLFNENKSYCIQSSGLSLNFDLSCTTAYCCHTDKCLRLLVFHKSLLNFLLFYTCKQRFHHLIKSSSNFANSSSAIQDPWSLVISLGTRLPRSTLHKGRSYASKLFCLQGG